MAKLGTVEQHSCSHWGEMGTRWGYRTVARSTRCFTFPPKPLHPRKSPRRSRRPVERQHEPQELQGWGIVKLSHVLGDKNGTILSP